MPDGEVLKGKSFWRQQRQCQILVRQQSEAEYIASSHAEQRLNERVDQQAAEMVDRANQQYVEKFQRPFSERKLFPQSLGSARRSESCRWSAYRPAAERWRPRAARRRRWKAPT